MADIGFYHLTRASADEALPRLLARTLEAGQRAVVMCGSDARSAALDEALWDSRDATWLPHGSGRDGDADLQPIWLTVADEAPNGARFLFMVDGASSGRLDAFDRVFDLFDGTDETAVAAARERWQATKAAGHAVTYWQQGARGWERKA